jgi:hypothetical protein
MNLFQAVEFYGGGEPPFCGSLAPDFVVIVISP